MKVAPIVEGHGEVSAFPILLRRLQQWRRPDEYLDVSHPVRVRRDRFLNKDEDFRKHLMLASAKCGDDGWVLILLDSDDDCPSELGMKILARAQALMPGTRISVVLANREYEAWFIAASESLNGKRGFVCRAGEVAEAERPRNAKGWMAERIAGGGYSETVDQPAFSALFDLEQAFIGSRSFRKLCSEFDRNIV